MTQKRTKEGVCAVCGRVRTLTAAGVMRVHLGDVYSGRWRQVCAGTGMSPSSIVEDLDLAVVEAAKAWRLRVAGSILGPHESQLAAAVDALAARSEETP